MEKWLPIKDFPGYEISNYGRVKSWRYSHGKRKIPRILKGSFVPPTGYKSVVLSRNNKKPKHQWVHRLVLKTFLGEPPTPKHQCAHNDGNSINNYIDNIRWATCKENQHDKIRHGTILRGEKITQSKLKTKDVIIIKKLIICGENNTQIAKKFNVTHSLISAIKLNKVWKHVK